MARVNIEERAAVGAKKLARIMGWSKVTAIGKLYYLWHDSQEMEQTHCTLEDIGLWMDLEIQEHDDIIDALIQTKFIEQVGDDNFLIIGNAKHIENLRQRREAGSLGGKRSAELRSANPSKELEEQAHAQANASSSAQALCEPSTVQCSAVQGSAVQSSTKHKKRKEALPAIFEPIASLAGDGQIEKFLERIPQETQAHWVKIYGIDHTKREILKAIGWLRENPPKKNLARFMTNWLSRSDPKKGTPFKTKQQQMTDNNRALLEAVERGDL